MMGAKDAATFHTTLCSLLLLSLSCECLAAELNQAQTALLEANTSWDAARNIPQTLFGLFFEEINHAGAGGIWAELVSNRGFEAGGSNTPSNIDPWTIIGDESSIYVKTERSSCFSKNIIALRMEVLCDECPAGSVGIYNPGFWGMIRFLSHCISALEHEHENINHETTNSVNGLQATVLPVEKC